MANGYYDYMWGNTQNQNQNFNPSSFAGIGRFDPNNLVNIRNRYQQSNQLMDPTLMMNQLGNVPQAIGGTDIDMQYTTGNEFNIPPRRNILSRFASGARNVAGDLVGGAGNFAGDLVSGAKNIYGDVKGGINRLLDNTMLGKIASMRDATNPRAANYNRALQGQIDYLKSNPEVAGDTLSYGNTRAGPKITGGMLAGQNLQSMYGSNDLIDMYNKQIAKHTKTIEGFADQWGNLEEDDPAAYAKKLAVHERRRDWAKAERDAAIAGTTGGGGAVTTGGGAVTPDRGGYQGPRTYDFDPGQARREGRRADKPGGFTDPGRGSYGPHRAEGGRIGYRDGEFVDEDINIQGPGFDVNENIEMAEEDPFRMRIQELMSKGLSWEDAYDIAAHEFQDEFAEGPEESFSEDQGIASLV